MATLNKVMLIGRLTKDPEPPRTLPNSGSQVVRFRFAVGRSRKNEQGGWDKDPNQLYIDCEAYHRPESKRNLVELISRYAKQGDPLFIEGRLVFEEWTDKQTNQQRSKHKVVVESIEFLGARQDGQGGSGGQAAGRPANATRSGGAAPDEGEEYGGGEAGGGDIPF